MKRPMTAITVLPLSAGRTAVRNAADSTRRNFKLRQSEYGLSLKDSPMLK